MKAVSAAIEVTTQGPSDSVDVTVELQHAIAESGIQTGQVTAMVVGSTAALTTLAFEPGEVRHDLAEALDVATSEPLPGQGDSAAVRDPSRACFIGPSVVLPVVDGQAPLGTHQHVVLLEFDSGPCERRIVVSILGE